MANSKLIKMTNVNLSFSSIVSRKEKEVILNQKSKVIWFTGLSGSGKTTLANVLEKELFERKFITQLLDGDNIRSGINSNLGFSHEDRMENIRRIAEISKLILNNGVICICAFVSPTEKIRNVVRNIVGEEDFLEIHVSTPLETCENRDTKGLYKKARRGEINNFTGIGSSYEMPLNPAIKINTMNRSAEDCMKSLLPEILPEISLSQ